MLLYRTTISAADRDRLVAAVAAARSSRTSFVPHLDGFSANLRRARVVPASEIAPDVITMNSSFTVTDPRTGRATRCTLVYPKDLAASWDDALSVLTPMGMALLGAVVGDDVCWTSPAGPEVATVAEMIYQPEALGHYRREPHACDLKFLRGSRPGRFSSRPAPSAPAGRDLVLASDDRR